MPIRNLPSTAGVSASALLPVGAGGPVSPEALRAQHDCLKKVLERPAGLPPVRSDDGRQTLGPMTVPRRAGLPPIGTHQLSRHESPQEHGAVRQAASGAEVKQVFVLDWDDCLRVEKGLNYQLMHNALTVAAREHGPKYPELTQAVDRLQAEIRGDRPVGDGDPLLMMSREDFSKYLLPRPEIFEARVLQDFVRKMLPNVSKERAQAVNNILEANFRRQYQALAQPRPESVQPQENFPFPNVQLDLTPGAQEFLDQCRNPESLVALISNRHHADVEKEVNQLGMAHYFDVVAGAPVVSQDKPSQPFPVQLRQRLLAALEGNDDQALGDALLRAVPLVAGGPQASAIHGSAKLQTQPSQAQLRDRLREALQSGDEAALQAVLAAARPFAEAELSRRLMAPLRGGDGNALRQALDEALTYAHPDTVKVGRVDLKPSSKRLLDSLARFSVQPEVPIVSYGDQVTDVKQLAGADNQRRKLEGVIVNPQHPSVGKSIIVDGIPTRVLDRFPAR